MNIRRLITSATLILGLGMPATGLAKDFDGKIYADPYVTAGTSSHSERPFNARVGVTISGEITENSSLGIDSSTIYEGRRKEKCGAIVYTRRLEKETFSSAIGISEMILDHPIPQYDMNNPHKYSETRESAALYLEMGYTRKINDWLNLKLSYQRNFADSETMEQYPSDRFSIGLQGKLEF
jgi:hypothetical protein